MSEHPVIKDWTYSKCGNKHRLINNKAFVKDALESMYTIIDPGGMQIMSPIPQEEKRQRFTEMLNLMAVELLGGVPDGFEEYT